MNAEKYKSAKIKNPPNTGGLENGGVPERTIGGDL